MKKRCFTIRYAQRSYRQRPAAYRLAMERAIVSTDAQRVCFDADHAGWHEARRIDPSRHVPLWQRLLDVGHAGKSVVKTALGVGRATDARVEARLDVCRRCPGGHAVWKDGDVHTCGPMLTAMREAGTSGGCGCILRKKAHDLAEDCPFGWWVTPDIG